MTGIPNPSQPSDLNVETCDLAKLARLVEAHAPYDGTFELRLPGVHVTKVSRAQKDMHHVVACPSLCLVAQGAKRIMLGKEIYEYDASRMLVYSLDVPVTAQVTGASLDRPYLGLRLDIDPARIAELTAKVHAQGLPGREDSHAISVDRVDAPVINAVVRLLELASRPEEADLLAPLVLDEILIRLLRSSLGLRLARIGREESKVHRISKAVSWVRSHFHEPLDVERLAHSVHMSPSSFHQHFKAVTEMSPLQYQKALRLQEARRLMLLTRLDAGIAGRQVGYQSASQFTREYGRYYGNAPTKDIAMLRRRAGVED
ncbi:AraC family transcriptional regulator [Mesoterricola silvestris]|uniref:AraC family transcriptional regulator n=1 Tax=Mesoterricola silvestris TaxID=2927979 RepID=A0AA48GPA4_9BACT|nr:AraC family transcriptional regulator [Mesoterricola silvestris]BDU73195.1 AraC family transcriptional regulator [Mesoterricola silvestris]